MHTCVRCICVTSPKAHARDEHDARKRAQKHKRNPTSRRNKRPADQETLHVPQKPSNLHHNYRVVDIIPKKDRNIICVYIYIDIDIYTLTHIYIYIHMYICVQVYMGCVGLHIYIATCIQLFVLVLSYKYE